MKHLMALVLTVVSFNASADCFIVQEKDKILKNEGQCQEAYAPHSTFDTDYVLVKHDSLERACEALRACGFIVT